MRRSHQYPTSIRLSTAMKRSLERQADKQRRSLNGLIVFVLESWLNVVEPPKGGEPPKVKPEEEKKD